MNIEEYKDLKKNVPFDQWTVAQCIEADRLIKDATISRLKVILADYPIPHEFKKWAVQVAQFHFGSVETDEMLMKFGAYPDWM
jgi:hypothetical protein